MGGLWGLVTVIGAAVFLAALAFVVIRNKNAPAGNRQAAEQSARDLREKLTAEREQREGRDEG